MNRILLSTLACLLLVTGLVLGVMAIAANRRADAGFGGSLGSVPDAPRKAAKNSEWMTEYSLTERSGRTFRSDELKGKVHVVNFFFAACPTVCRLQTASIQSLQSEFVPLGVTFLSITCDPENDRPAVLAQYAKEFHADPEQWLFLTGELPYIRRVGAEVYYVPVDKQTHSESLLVLDRAGKIRGRFSWKDAKEIAKMKTLLHELLAEKPPSAEEGATS